MNLADTPPVRSSASPSDPIEGVQLVEVLSDFANPLDSAEIEHINQIFEYVIMSLPPVDGTLGVVGTPQSPTDILHKLQDNPQFLTVKFPAISDYDLKTTAWPEMFDFARLQKIKNQVGDNAFEVEYQLYPRELANSFLAADRLRACVGENLARCKTRSNRAPLRTGTIPRAGPSMGRWMSARPCTHRTLCSSSRTQRDG